MKFKVNGSSFFIWVYLLFSFVYTSYGQVTRIKNINYVPDNSPGFNERRQSLDVYFSQKSKQSEVLIFIHGGSWRKGNKNIYKLMGKQLAKKGKVAVIINYRLWPEVKYKKMTEDCVDAVNWVYQNIEKYGGDKEKISISGHSAGGHLAAFISLGKEFKKKAYQNPIKTCILIDPFGLDMHAYFKEYDDKFSQRYLKVFSKKNEQWKKASPFYLIHSDCKINFHSYIGSKTYKPIIDGSIAFNEKMKKTGNISTLETIEGKKHIGMITQLFSAKNALYKDIIKYMEEE